MTDDTYSGTMQFDPAAWPAVREAHAAGEFVTIAFPGGGQGTALVVGLDETTHTAHIEGAGTPWETGEAK